MKQQIFVSLSVDRVKDSEYNQTQHAAYKKLLLEIFVKYFETNACNKSLCNTLCGIALCSSDIAESCTITETTASKSHSDLSQIANNNIF